MSQKYRRSKKYNSGNLPSKKITLEDQIKMQREADLLREIEAAREASRQIKERELQNRKSVWDDQFDITGGAL